MRFKKGDSVIVIAGNDKGKEGTIVTLKGDRVIVKGVNVRKKHMKGNDRQKGGKIVEFEAPIHVSNIMYCADGAPVKLRARMTEDKKKEIFYINKNKEEKVLRTV